MKEYTVFLKTNMDNVLMAIEVNNIEAVCEILKINIEDEDITGFEIKIKNLK